MVKVEKRAGEDFTRLLGRFSRGVKSSGLLNEVKRRGAFEGKAEKKKRKDAASRKRALRAAGKLE